MMTTMKLQYLVLSTALVTFGAYGDSSTLDAAIGGGIGGAAGAAIGNEIGGREGAIVGGGLGGAVGVAVNTKDDSRHHSSLPLLKPEYQYRPNYRGHPHDYHCPPGQRKKGRC